MGTPHLDLTTFKWLHKHVLYRVLQTSNEKLYLDLTILVPTLQYNMVLDLKMFGYRI